MFCFGHAVPSRQFSSNSASPTVFLRMLLRGTCWTAGLIVRQPACASLNLRACGKAETSRGSKMRIIPLQIIGPCHALQRSAFLSPASTGRGFQAARLPGWHGNRSTRRRSNASRSGRPESRGAHALTSPAPRALGSCSRCFDAAGHSSRGGAMTADKGDRSDRARIHHARCDD